MTEARNLKQREYFTSITQHDSTRNTNQIAGVRDSNTFKSKALIAEPDVRAAPTYTAKREHIFQDRPVSA